MQTKKDNSNRQLRDNNYRRFGDVAGIALALAAFADAFALTSALSLGSLGVTVGDIDEGTEASAVKFFSVSPPAAMTWQIVEFLFDTQWGQTSGKDTVCRLICCPSPA